MFVKKCSGSSPHSRGTPTTLISSFLLIRIIPAFAGNTDNTVLFLPHVKDHPRIRGEHFPLPLDCHCSLGSSPHSRGTPSISHRSALSDGIIPAFAGNTTDFRPCIFTQWDHPRIRGEHTVLKLVKAEDPGSSPHSRGTPF